VNSGAFTYAQIYDDVIFAGASTGPTGGMDLTISGGALLPNKAYSVSIYAFDSGGAAVRNASWFDATNPAVPALTTSFINTNPPTANDSNKFTGIVKTNGSGALVLQGRNTTGYVGNGVQLAVFLNGFEVNEFTGLTAEVNTTTGAVRFLNEQTGSLSLSYYELRSSTGALNPAGWVSLDDAEGGDPVGTGWDEAGGSNANILSEGNLTSATTLAAGASASLGSAFTTGAAQNLQFFYAAPGELSLRPGFVKYVTGGNIVADFNHDGTVNAGDLVVWKASFGVNANGDADGDGDSDGNDFLIWQRRLGATTATAAAGAVPEPTAALLLVLGGIAAAVARRGR